MTQETHGYVLEFSEKGIKVVSGRMRSFKNVVTGTTKQLNIFKTLLAGVAAQMTVAKISQHTDSWQKLTNQIKVVTSSEQEMYKTRQILINQSRQLRTDVNATTKLYTRLKLQADRLGATDQELMDFTEAVGKSLAIMGANGSESNAVMLQLSQAMGTAAVNGDEFRTVAENDARLIKAVADELGITTGEVKKLTSEGQLMTDKFFRAVLSQLPTLRAEFKKTDVTFSQAGSVLNNAFKVTVGRFMEVTGLAQTISDLVVKFADNIKKGGEDLVVYFTFAKEKWDSMVDTKGLPAALSTTFEAISGTFIASIVSGFKALAPVFLSFGRLIGTAFAEVLKDTLPSSMAKAIESRQKQAMLTPEKVEEVMKGRTELLSFYNKRNRFEPKEDYRARLEQMAQTPLSYAPYDDLKKEASKIWQPDAAEFSEGQIKTFAADLQTALDSVNDTSGKFEEFKATMEEIWAPFIGDSEEAKDRLREIREEMQLLADPGNLSNVNEQLEQVEEKAKGIAGAFQAISDMSSSFSTDAIAGLKSGITSLHAQVTDFEKVFSDLATTTIKGFSDELTEALTGGEADFKSFARSAINSLISVMIQAIITSAIMGSLGFTGTAAPTSGGGTSTSVNAAQFGDTVDAGEPTIIGERRPELWIPSTSGRVANTEQGTGGSQEPMTLINVVPSALDELATPSGRKMQINFVKENRQEIKSILRI